LWPAAEVLWPWLSGAIWQRILSMLAVIFGGVAVYGASCIVLRAASISDVKGMLGRSRAQT
ncbi:MAG: hypothetical protein OXC54_07680, partial [Rhodospirillaceae bacterium]|nr:hypothetical protein [Rhodospirillaceae bacterium]